MRYYVWDKAKVLLITMGEKAGSVTAQMPLNTACVQYEIFPVEQSHDIEGKCSELNRLLEQQKQTAIEFHNSQRHSFDNLDNEERILDKFIPYYFYDFLFIIGDSSCENFLSGVNRICAIAAGYNLLPVVLDLRANSEPIPCENPTIADSYLTVGRYGSDIPILQYIIKDIAGSCVHPGLIDIDPGDVEVTLRGNKEAYVFCAVAYGADAILQAARKIMQESVPSVLTANCRNSLVLISTSGPRSHIDILVDINDLGQDIDQLLFCNHHDENCVPDEYGECVFCVPETDTARLTWIIAIK